MIGDKHGAGMQPADRRAAQLRAAQQAYQQVQPEPGAPGVGDRIGAIPRMISAAMAGRYRGMGKGKLAMFAVAMLYIISPVDVIPEILLGPLGLVDDAGAAAFLVSGLLGEAARFLRWERNQHTVIDADRDHRG